MPVARIVGGIGRASITAGLLLLAFVSYQLWGTGLAEAQAQSELRDDFEASLTVPPAPEPPAAPVEPGGASTSSTVAVTAAPVEPGGASTSSTVAVTAAPATPEPTPVPTGEAVAIIRIPTIGVDKAVVEGVSVEDLKKGPGHYPATPLPGEAGNAAIAGHRTTYGAPFGRLDELVAGDEILVTTRTGDHRYVVDRISVVRPSQVDVLRATDEARLTLTTCHPKYSARQRLIVSAVLTDEVGPPPVPPPVATPAPMPTVDADTDTDTGGVEEPVGGSQEPDDDPVVAGEAVALEDPILTGDPSARAPAAGWGVATAAIAFGAWFVGRRWRRWPSYLLGLPVGTVTLFLCFEQIARLLPPNI